MTKWFQFSRGWHQKRGVFLKEQIEKIIYMGLKKLMYILWKSYIYIPWYLVKFRVCVPIQFIKKTSGFWSLGLIMSISCLYIFCIYVYILSIYILSICLHKQSICIYTCFMSISCIYTFCLYVYKNCLYVYIHHFSNFIYTVYIVYIYNFI